MVTLHRYTAVADGFLSTAVPVIGHDAPEQEWLAARRAGIGASEIASVLRVPGAFTSPFALWWSKRMSWDTERTFAMRVGQVLEEPIGQLFAEEHPGLTVVRPLHRLYRHPEHEWMLASPDFLAVEQCGVCMGTGFYLERDHATDDLRRVEGRCDNCDGVGGWVEPVEAKSDQGKDWKGQPPVKHLMQLWQQRLVFGSPRGHLVRLSGKKLTAYVAEPDADVDAAIIAGGQWFAGCLASGTAPDVDGHDATEDTLRRLYPPVNDDESPAATTAVPLDLLGKFQAAWEARNAALDEFAAVRNEMRLHIGEARFGVDPADRVVIEHRRYKKDGYEVGAHEVDEIRKAW